MTGIHKIPVSPPITDRECSTVLPSLPHLGAAMTNTTITVLGDARRSLLEMITTIILLLQNPHHHMLQDLRTVSMTKLRRRVPQTKLSLFGYICRSREDFNTPMSR